MWAIRCHALEQKLLQRNVGVPEGPLKFFTNHLCPNDYVESFAFSHEFRLSLVFIDFLGPQ